MSAPVVPPPKGRPKVTAAELARHVAVRKRMGLPLRVPVPLMDGRVLVMLSSEGKTMTCQQVNKGDALKVGEIVSLEPDPDGVVIRLRVERWRKTNRKSLVDLLVLGRFEGPKPTPEVQS